MNTYTPAKLVLVKLKLKLKLIYDWQSVDQSVLISGEVSVRLRYGWEMEHKSNENNTQTIYFSLRLGLHEVHITLNE
jgi:hypothetical protein